MDAAGQETSSGAKTSPTVYVSVTHQPSGTLIKDLSSALEDKRKLSFAAYV